MDHCDRGFELSDLVQEIENERDPAGNWRSAGCPSLDGPRIGGRKNSEAAEGISQRGYAVSKGFVRHPASLPPSAVLRKDRRDRARYSPVDRLRGSERRKVREHAGNRAEENAVRKRLAGGAR